MSSILTRRSREQRPCQADAPAQVVDGHPDGASVRGPGRFAERSPARGASQARTGAAL